MQLLKLPVYAGFTTISIDSSAEEVLGAAYNEFKKQGLKSAVSYYVTSDSATKVVDYYKINTGDYNLTTQKIDDTVPGYVISLTGKTDAAVITIAGPLTGAAYDSAPESIKKVAKSGDSVVSIAEATGITAAAATTAPAKPTAAPTAAPVASGGITVAFVTNDPVKVGDLSLDSYTVATDSTGGQYIYGYLENKGSTPL